MLPEVNLLKRQNGKTHDHIQTLSDLQLQWQLGFQSSLAQLMMLYIYTYKTFLQVKLLPFFFLG